MRAGIAWISWRRARSDAPYRNPWSKIPLRVLGCWEGCPPAESHGICMSLKRQTLWSMAPLIVVSVVGFFSVPLFYRSLGDQMYALLGYVATFSGMFGFADLGLGVAVGRYVGTALGAGDQTAVREYWGTGNLIALPLLGLMALAFMALGCVFGPKWFNIAPEHIGLLRACFLVGGLGLFFNYYGQLWVVLIQTHLDFRYTSLLRVGTNLAQVVPAMFLAYQTRNPFYVAAWSLPVGCAQLAILVLHARRRYGLGFSLRAARWSRAREMAVFTSKTFASLLISSLFVQMDRLLAGRFAVAADYSHYVISTNVGVRLQGLGGAVMGPVFHNTTRALGGSQASSPARIYDEMFQFMFGWYLLAALWVAAWHPLLLHLWLDVWRGGGAAVAQNVAPLFVPVIVAYCLTAMASISAPQLSALNRMGTACGFIALTGLLTLAGVWFGWQAAGVVGVAYGFLFGRLGLIAQDLFVIRLIKARGWLAAETWTSVAAQAGVAAVCALPQLLLPRNSLWHLLPATLHAGLVAGWLVRHPLRRILDQARAKAFPLAASGLEPPGS